MKNTILIFLFLNILNLNSLHSQSGGLYNIKKCVPMVWKENSCNDFKNAFVEQDEFLKKIQYKIPELEYTYSFQFEEENLLSLNLSYNIYKNYEDTYNQQYYGTVNLKGYRIFKIPGFTSTVYVVVFEEVYNTVLNNPSIEIMKENIIRIVDELTDKFALQYYQENH